MASTLQTAFPILQSVVADDAVLEDSLPLPALLIDLPRFEPDTDRGAGTLNLTTFFEARLLLDRKDPNVHHRAKGLATRLSWFIQNQTWGQQMAPCRITGISNESIDAEGNLCWLIEFTTSLQVGELAMRDHTDPLHWLDLAPDSP